VFLVRSGDIDKYLDQFRPVQLRWDKRKEVNSNYPVRNLGESKGETFERVIIYPTSPMSNWMKDNNYDLKSGPRAKFYVGITRAKHSSAIIYDFADDEIINGCEKYIPE
jgi:DNA helicase-2/ATP-dependent DNA helicase PcrA